MIDVVATTARLVSRADLNHDDLEGMYRLMASHFDGVSREQFRTDLAEKNWTVLIERPHGLVGFSTLLAYETTFEGAPISVICSGDTIVAPEAWTSQTLPRAWIESVATLRRQYPRGIYLWLLITSGFRTYRFLPVFWKQFYPRFDSRTPLQWQRLIDHLAGERFGDQYDRASGIVRLQHPQRLLGELAGIPSGRSDDPHIAFFDSLNPGHLLGDELVCVTELSPENLTSAGGRMASATPQW